MSARQARLFWLWTALLAAVPTLGAAAALHLTWP